MARLTPWLLAAPAGAGLLAAALAAFTWVIAWRIEKALPPLGSFIEVGGARLHYLDTGPPSDGAADAPAIVLIPGLSAQMRNFTYGVVAPLQRHHRVIVIDRPGSGYSIRAPGASATLSAQAALLARFIRALALQRPLVVGHSLGGAVALALALDHPDNVGGLALIAPLTQPQRAAPDALRGLAIQSRLWRWLSAWTIAMPSAILHHRRVLDGVFGPDAAPPDFATKGGGLLSLRPSSFYGASTDIVHASEDLPGMVERYASLAVPVGVLYGTADRILDHVSNGRALVGTIPDLELELVEGGGHMTPVVAPDRTADFIARVSARIVAARNGGASGSCGIRSMSDSGFLV